MPFGTINVDSVVNSDGITSGGAYGFKNRIINGAMVIDQRNAGASITTNAYCPDRWLPEQTTDGVRTAQQVSDAPTGFVNSLKLTTTTADASLAATQYSIVRQGIEGYNTVDLMWGTASAATVTLSFWVKSSLTGTFGGVFGNSAFNRSYPFTYTISSANTWEQKTVTIAGDTTGTWEKTNSAGIQLYFGLGAGSTYSGTAGAWTGSGLVTATGTVNVMGTLNATWQITGVQLEKGSTATSFDYRPYGTELQLCQRYCYVFRGDSVGLYGNIALAIGLSATDQQPQLNVPIPMRTQPTLSYSAIGDLALHSPGVYRGTATSAAVNSSQSNAYRVVLSTTTVSNAAFASGKVYSFEFNNTSSGWLSFSAEL